ncbi:MAG: hypothetical protein LBB05_00075 [Puniceicoccales bacterium]|nr:hypothetical protein [Puniceicoccales bacterium]
MRQLWGTTKRQAIKQRRMLTVFDGIPLWWRQPRSDEAPKNDACCVSIFGSGVCDCR